MAIRALRIGAASESVTDRRKAIEDLAANENIDIIVGDWMSEYNMVQAFTTSPSFYRPLGLFPRRNMNRHLSHHSWKR